MNMKMAESKAEASERERFFSIALFEKIKKYLHSAKKDDPPVIGTTENFCEPDPSREKIVYGVEARPAESRTKVTMKKALADATPGHADLVNKFMEEEVDDE